MKANYAVADTAATGGPSPAKQRRSASLWRRVQQLGLASAGAGGARGGPSPFRASPTRSSPGGALGRRPSAATPQPDGVRGKTLSPAPRSASIMAGDTHPLRSSATQRCTEEEVSSPS